MLPTLEQFQLATGSDETRAAMYYEAFLETIERFKIETVEQRSAFCATISIESDRLTQMEENLYYRDASRLAKIFPRAFPTEESARPYCRMPKELSLKLYNGYHGRGGFQLTWEKNYRLHGDRLGFDYVGDPSLLVTPRHAILSAGSFWDLNGCNEVAHDMGQVTRKVNGPARLHLAERIAQNNVALEVFA